MYYILSNNEIKGCNADRQALVNSISLGFLHDVEDAQILETDKNIYWIDNKFYFEDDEEYIEKKAQEEAERIGNLQVTKRVFMLGLQQMGVTYTQLKELIATNEQAQMEWELCVELQRKNPLLDLMASQFGVSSAMLDYIFQKANGEDIEPPVGVE